MPRPNRSSTSTDATRRPVQRAASFLRDRGRRLGVPGGAPRRPKIGGTNSNDRWHSIGPPGVEGGEAIGRPMVSGRITGLAVIPQEKDDRLYVASAHGGVWRSLDGGSSWQARMDSFDVNPLGARTTSLSCGALWVRGRRNPDRDTVFVGTGNALDSYFGIGIVRSETGGCDGDCGKWIKEASEPDLEGYTCAQFAGLKRAAPEVVATNRGLYIRRESRWERVLEGNFSSVVAGEGRADGRRYFAADMKGKIWSAEKPAKGWTLFEDTRFGLRSDPRRDRAGRTGLSISNGFVYALVADAQDRGPVGVFQLHPDRETWCRIAGHPVHLFGDAGNFQGDFDLAITADPRNPSLLYLGGASIQVASATEFEFGAGLFRCEVSGDQHTELAMDVTYIGAQIHPDVHVIVPAPDDRLEAPLWVGCDGGVFHVTESADPAKGAKALNNDLNTFLVQHLAQDPKEPGLLMAATQDNGCLLRERDGDKPWQLLKPGDSGRVIVNWEESNRVLRTVYGTDVRGTHNLHTTDVEQRSLFDQSASYRFPPSSSPWPAFNASPSQSRGWTGTDASFTAFYAPMAGCPDPWTAALDRGRLDSELVAFGSCRPWLSEDFGRNWRALSTGNVDLDHLGSRISALSFADRKTLFAGTEEGRVFLFERPDDSATWHRSRLPMPNGAGNQAVTSIAPVPGKTGTVYATFGGDGPLAPVWLYDDCKWHNRSGEDGSRLPKVHHSWIAIHPVSKQLFVATDIGVWASKVGKEDKWEAFATGLPDTAVTHLLIHCTGKLRAATYGRGVFEIDL